MTRQRGRNKRKMGALKLIIYRTPPEAWLKVKFIPVEKDRGEPRAEAETKTGTGHVRDSLEGLLWGAARRRSRCLALQV